MVFMVRNRRAGTKRDRRAGTKRDTSTTYKYIVWENLAQSTNLLHLIYNRIMCHRTKITVNSFIESNSLIRLY